MRCNSLMRAGAIGAMGMGLLIGATGAVSARPVAQAAQSPRADPLGAANQPSVTAPADTPQITPWQTITVRPGDSLSQIFAQAGLVPRELATLLELGDVVEPLDTLRAGETLTLRKTPDGQLMALRYPIDALNTLTISRRGTAAHGPLSAQVERKESQTRRLSATGTVRGSLSGSLARAGIPANIATQLSHIYRYRADLSRSLQAGDRFSVIYEAEFVGDARVRSGPVLAAAISTDGSTREAFRALDDDGHPHYYDARGRSYEPSFSRKPVTYTRISSPFDPDRRHPILHIRRPHLGVDMAAARGTPIHAAADGTVEFVGSKHGYGRLVELDHADGYETRYGHMHQFVRGLRDGDHVAKGQIIGYVGATGEATGPHLHFEIRRDGIAHDPMTMSLPEGQPLSETRLALFINRIQPLIARLDAPDDIGGTLIASTASQLQRTNCHQATAINAALALAPARASQQHPLSELFCVVRTAGNA